MTRAKPRRVVKLENGNKFVKFRGQQRRTEGRSNFDKLYRDNASQTVGNKKLNLEGKKNSSYANRRQKQRNAGRDSLNREYNNRGLKNKENKQKSTLQEPKRVNNKNILHVNESGNPKSCLVYFGRARIRALVDTFSAYENAT